MVYCIKCKKDTGLPYKDLTYYDNRIKYFHRRLYCSKCLKWLRKQKIGNFTQTKFGVF